MTKIRSYMRGVFFVWFFFSMLNAGYAADINVSAGDVSPASDGRCSLIEAFNAAEEDAAKDACASGSGEDRLILEQSVYELSSVVSGDFGNTGTPCVSTNITIKGNGSTIRRLDGGDSFRILCVATSGTLTLENLSVEKGRAEGASLAHQRGGGVLVQGRLVVSGGAFTANVAVSQGGAAYVDGGSMYLTSTKFSGNSSHKGGAIRVDAAGNLDAISGNFLSNTADYGAGIYVNNSTANILYSSFTNNAAALMGGGVVVSGSTATVKQGYFSQNTAGEKGGAIRVDNSSSMVLESSTVDNNSASGYGGGGVYVIKSDMNIKQSTLSNNQAKRGAALYVDVSHVDMTNSTFSGNSASVYGGAIYVDADESLPPYNSSISVNHVTMYGNNATGGGGGLWLNPVTKATLSNSAVVGNSYRDCAGPGELISQTVNWFGDSYCSGLAKGSARLGPLADNGGSTKTHMPLSGSGLIDAASSTACASLDQRGKPRPKGAGCDIGAVEWDESATGLVIEPFLYLLL